jgi:DNA-directed RNA polymerase subunit F
MVKKIKFNLILDGNPVRNIEQLRENFNVDDIIEYSKNGLLLKWLDIRGYHDYKHRIELISQKNSLKYLKELIKIFSIPQDSENLEEALLEIESREAKYNKLKELAELKFNFDVIIHRYHNDYETLKNKIEENSTNIAFLKNSNSQFEKDFFELFKLEHKQLFYRFFEDYPLVIIVFLMSERLRGFFLNDTKIIDKITDIFEIKKREVQKIYSQYREDTNGDENFKNILNFYSENTEHQWRNIESEEILIVNATAGIKLREKNQETQEVTHVFAKGTLFHGLDINSYKSTHFVKYIKLSGIDGFLGSLKSFKGVTNGYWKDIEPSSKKFMILHIEKDSYIRSLGNHGEEKSVSEVKGKFPILKGIDYKNNNETSILYYIEV